MGSRFKLKLDNATAEFFDDHYVVTFHKDPNFLKRIFIYQMEGTATIPYSNIASIRFSEYRKKPLETFYFVGNVGKIDMAPKNPVVDQYSEDAVLLHKFSYLLCWRDESTNKEAKNVYEFLKEKIIK